jgi:ATP-dependent phosphoenolpyruvate carboxykinase
MLIIMTYVATLYRKSCRDQHGVYTSSKRRSGEMIARSVKPHFVVEEKLSGDDVEWHPTIRETEPEVAERALKLLDIVFQRPERSHMTSGQNDEHLCA